jgi:pimeloyl-ACP methyl ester carboxylesterase
MLNAKGLISFQKQRLRTQLTSKIFSLALQSLSLLSLVTLLSPSLSQAADWSRFEPARTTTISGISSGGFMAVQMATIFSDRFAGVGTAAGGVYFCAQTHFTEQLSRRGNASFLLFGPSSKAMAEGLDNLAAISQLKPLANEVLASDFIVPLFQNPIYVAEEVCMRDPTRVHQSDLLHASSMTAEMNLDFMKVFEKEKLIAPTRNIRSQRVFLSHGKVDHVLNPGMLERLEQYYRHFGVSDKQLKVVLGEGGHNYPTDREGLLDCATEGVPYVASCKVDLAGRLLAHVLDRSLKRGKVNPAHLYRVSQQVLANRTKDPAFANSVGEYGYLYANSFCLDNPGRCDIHVALHGCKMSDSYDDEFEKNYETVVATTHILGMSEHRLERRKLNFGVKKFAENAGYADYAEPTENRLMILFPQTWISSENYPVNPKGCWDWYGANGPEYATNQGLETKWLMGFIERVKAEPKKFILKSPRH